MLLRVNVLVIQIGNIITLQARDSFASSIGNISTASTESENERRRSKKGSNASNASRRTNASDVNVNVTPQRASSRDDTDVSSKASLCQRFFGVNKD